MKKIYLITIALAIHVSLLAQTYYPFPTDSATWSVEEFYYNPSYPMGQNGCIAKHYGYIGDTMISGLSYGKLYGNNQPADFPYSDTAFNPLTARYMAAVREDASKKVWVRRPNDSTDILYYDYALEVGDTFCFDYFGQGCYPVAWVDSVLIAGNYRRRLNFQAQNVESWIEGIGSETGWFEWQYIGTFGWELLCFSENGSQLYGMNDCHCDTYMGLGIEDGNFTDSGIKVYPNPAQARVEVDLSELGIVQGQLEMYNLIGAKVRELKVEGHLVRMDLAGLSPGTYLLTIVDGKGLRHTRKVLKSGE